MADPVPGLPYILNAAKTAWQCYGRPDVSATDGVVTPPTPGTFWVTGEVGGNDYRTKANGDQLYDKNGLYDVTTKAIGRDLGGRLKFFSGSGANGTLANAVNNHLVATSHSLEPLPVYCFKTFTAKQLTDRLDVITEPEVWVYGHEFYSATESGWTSYNNSWQSIRATRDAHRNKDLVTLQAASATYQERESPGGWAYLDPTNIDAFGADAYSSQSGKILSADTMFGPQHDAWVTMKATNPNLKWIVSEYNVSRLKTTTTLWSYDEWTTAVQAHMTYLIANGCSGVTFWWADNRKETPMHDYSIDKTTDPAGNKTDIDTRKAAWVKTLMDQYPL